MEERGDLGQMVTASMSPVREIETTLLRLGAPWGPLADWPQTWQSKDSDWRRWYLQQGLGKGSAPLALGVQSLQEVSRSGRCCLREVGGEGGDDPLCKKVLCSTCASFCLFRRFVFFLQARLCSDERDLDGHGGRRRQEASQLREVLMLLLESPSFPPLGPPYLKSWGRGDREREEERSMSSVQAGEKAIRLSQ